jgi:exonuclease SbcD
VAISHLRLDDTCRNVLLTHQFVTGAQSCDSEEVSVGGSDNVDAAVFSSFDYVALGHIHGAQNIGSNRIRYCGTPLKYSLSEENHEKSVTMVELGAKGDLKLTLLPLQPKHELRSIRGAFSQLHDTALSTEDYIYAILTDEEEIHEAIGKLRVIFPNLMEMRYDNTRTRATQLGVNLVEAETKTPMQLFEEFYDKQNGQPMSDVQRKFMQQLIDTAMEESL